jgi:hypothetical protein
MSRVARCSWTVWSVWSVWSVLWIAALLCALPGGRAAAQVEWTRVGDGPVLTPEAAGGWRRLYHPFVLRGDDGFTMWFLADRNQRNDPQRVAGIARATSLDGLEWTADEGLVLPRLRDTWEDHTYGPRVLFDMAAEPAYRMWYAGNKDRVCRIGHATSSDGVAWERHAGNPVLSPSQPWEEACMDLSAILYDGAAYRIWYNAGAWDLTLNAIGFATSSDGLTWTKHAGNPVLREGSPDVPVGTFAPCVLFDARADRYEMWYMIIIESSVSYSIGYATSMDGIAWRRHPANPVFSPDGGWDFPVGTPAVIFDGHEYLMWYSGGPDNGPVAIGLATAPWSIPKASFTVDTAEPAAGEPLVFDASRSAAPRGAIAAYRWDFGDGATAEGPEPIRTHTYTKPGHRVAVLTAIDEDGNEGSVARAIDVRLRSEGLEPWTCTDIGERTLPSGARFEGEGEGEGNGEGRSLLLFTRGGDIASRADAFHFVHREVEGDFTLTARIDSVEASSPGAKLGLMVRESLEENARHAAVVFFNQPGGLVRLLRRTQPGGTTPGTSDATRQQPPELWLRLQRRDGESAESAGITEITAQASVDGETWRNIGEPVRFDPPLPGAVQLGVAATGGLPTLQGGYQDLLARLSRLELELPEPPEPEPEPAAGPFLRGDCNGDGQVAGQVTDAVFLLNFNFTGGPEPPCLAACDANGDGQVSGQVTDAIYLLQFNFLGGPAPPAPFPECGASRRSEDERLGCAEPPASCR